MLPTELWCHVFSFMTGKDVALAVALVCKEWSAIVSEQTLWRALYLSEWELSKRDHIDINLHRLSWRQLYQRKRSEERFWWKSLFEEDYEQLSEIFVYTSNKENSLAPREFDVAKIQQDSQNRVDDQLIFVIDDQQVCKMSQRKDSDNRGILQSANGLLPLFNPRTGDLHYHVVLPSKRLGRYNKQYVLTPLVAFLDSLPPQSVKPKFICNNGRTKLQEILFEASIQTECIPSFPFFIITGLLEIPQLLYNVQHASPFSHGWHTVNMYDDWLDTLSPYQAFCRLALLMRALRSKIWTHRTMMSQQKFEQKEPNNNNNDDDASKAVHLWPNLTEKGWLALERQVAEDIVRRDTVARGFAEPETHSFKRATVRRAYFAPDLP